MRCVLVNSCKRDQKNGWNDVVRETWAKSSPVPVFFVVGDGCFARQPDELKLNVPDHYLGLPVKTKESLAWAVRNGYARVFCASTSTYVDTARLEADGSYRWDYVGNLTGSVRGPFADMRPGFNLGTKAMCILLDTPIWPNSFPGDNYVDEWIGRALLGHVEWRDDKRYSMGMGIKEMQPDPRNENDVISVNLADWTGKYEPDWMRQVHANRFRLPHVATSPRKRWRCPCKHCQGAGR